MASSYSYPSIIALPSQHNCDYWLSKSYQGSFQKCCVEAYRVPYSLLRLILFSKTVISLLECFRSSTTESLLLFSHQHSSCSHNYSFTTHLEFQIKPKNLVQNSPKSLVSQRYSKTAVAMNSHMLQELPVFVPITVVSTASCLRLPGDCCSSYQTLGSLRSRTISVLYVFQAPGNGRGTHQ